ncbi:hypothetical protein [Streptomyces sp. CB03911]|uniref:helix-turn-helix transcriptional regulator n=1 Tax=Streptomyces sp. CB03911 TaxID=1804758 RepID=UPI00093DF22A|nr:hypothetical protein [Streptomyces sp. CB03911]OKI19260.1 hypothetical protein A6A07_07100 [Streptomyces sp. CB03911]
MTPWHIRMARRHGQSAVLYSALALSAPGEFSLAILAGWSPYVAWLMPAVMSMYAAISARNAREWSEIVQSLRDEQRHDDAASAKRKRGRAVRGALLALFGATAAQIVEHVLTTGAHGATAWVVIVVSAVPPLVAAHVLHLDPAEDVEPAVKPITIPIPGRDPWKFEVNKREPVRLQAVRKAVKAAPVDEWLTIPKAAERLGVAASTLYRRRESPTNPLRVRDEGKRQLVLWSDVAPVNAI